jgi:hypothetical protein
MLAKLRIHPPSHATVVAYLALFVALGGSAYAVATVTGKDIKNRSITKADIKKNGLTGREILERALGRVPRARRAGIANNSLNALQAGNAASADISKNSDALAGQGAGFFEKSSRTSFGRAGQAPAGESGEQPLLSWPEMGVEVTTSSSGGGCGSGLAFAVRNTKANGPSATVVQKDGSDGSAAAGSETDVCTVNDEGADFEVTDSTGRMLFVDCASANGEIRCVGIRSEP